MWKTAEFSVDVGGGNVKKLSGNILRGKDGDDSAYCVLCKVEFSVRHRGANNVRKHFSTNKHISFVTATSTSWLLSSYRFGTNSTAVAARKQMEVQQLKVQPAEALFVQFVTEHNLPFRTGDHFTKLVKSMFPDPEIAWQFHCSQTKTLVLSRYGNSPSVHDDLIAKLTQSTQAVYHSLLVDESNDCGVVAKDLVVLVRFFNVSIMTAVTCLIGLPTANDSTTAAIFTEIDKCLTSRGFSYGNMLSFNSGTYNTMRGQRNGVLAHLWKNNQIWLYLPS